MGNLIRWAVLVGLAVVAAVVGGVFGWLLIGAFLCGVRCGMRYEWADARGLGIVAPESRISVAVGPALIVLGAGLWLSGGGSQAAGFLGLFLIVFAFGWKVGLSTEHGRQ